MQYRKPDISFKKLQQGGGNSEVYFDKESFRADTHLRLQITEKMASKEENQEMIG